MYKRVCVCTYMLVRVCGSNIERNNSVAPVPRARLRPAPGKARCRILPFGPAVGGGMILPIEGDGCGAGEAHPNVVLGTGQNTTLAAPPAFRSRFVFGE